MKYTAIINQDGLQIVAVNGCTTCPHMSKETPIGSPDFMQCNRDADFGKRSVSVGQSKPGSIFAPNVQLSPKPQTQNKLNGL